MQASSLPPIELVALHKHWCVADAVKVVIGAPTLKPEAEEEAIKRWGTEFAMLGEQASMVARISVWYALLQVVVEGYQSLNPKFEPIDKLLSHEDYVRGLRRFRNATFHFQEDPLSEKVLEFLDMKDSEHWIADLNKQFGGFFLERLPIKQELSQIEESGIGDEMKNMMQSLPWAPNSLRKPKP